MDQALLTRIGQEIRTAREAADLPQQAVADLFQWKRDAISKLERGLLNISLVDYLRLVDFLREFLPDHPAVPLAEHILRPRRRR